MTDREVMQQALEALLWADAQGENWQQVVKKAIKPIQEAAAQPEPVQEPFGYLWPTGSHPEFRFTQQKRDGADGMPLYTAPPQQQAEPVQEPFEDLATELFVVAQRSPADGGFSDTIDRIESWLREHFSTQPQRKELSAGEILNMMPSTIPAAYDGELMEFARAIEAKTKEGT